MPRTVTGMQPYLFPYLGYFQLIANSDVFAIGDDMQFVRGAWINRNRVLAHGEPKLFSVPLKKGSLGDSVRDRRLGDDFEREAAALLKMISRLYAKAPYRSQTLPLIEQIFACPERNLALFAEHSLRLLCRHMGIDTPICRTSELTLDKTLDRQERVIEITRQLGGDCYINPIGGIDLYCPARFREAGVKLRFLKMDEVEYQQLKHSFVPSLSIIDVLMFNAPEALPDLLRAFTLVEGVEPNTTRDARASQGSAQPA
ncbi:WbqC family protein [Stutzerimonas tarimensis]|uniref:WbqC family protein n=1 Tax=Stutzerimonas tarimensis TaxID=1507735 RepID=A0ABV7T2Z7_9GAMM